MSNLDPRPDAVELRASVVRAVDVVEARKAAVGDGTEVRRRLPGRRGQPGGGKRGDARAPAGRDAVNHAVVGRPRPVFVVGGVPLGEKLVMWWNFVGRSHEEIVTARNAWDRGEWGEVGGYARNRLPAPALPPGKLKPR